MWEAWVRLRPLGGDAPNGEGSGERGAGVSVQRGEWDEIVVEPIVRFDRTKLDPWLGVVVAIAVAVPVGIGLATTWVEAGVMAALGAFNLFLGVGGMPTRSRARATVLAWVLNAAGLGLGTVVVSLGGPILLEVAFGVAALSAVHVVPAGRWAAITAAVLFGMGVGLPGASLLAASQRVELILAGGAWAIGTSLLARWVRRLRSGTPGGVVRTQPRVLPGIDRNLGLIGSAVTGVAAAAAFGLGNALGLPRDYWTILTVVVVFQTGMLAAIATSTARLVGTLIGAVLGGVLTAVVAGPAAATLVISVLAGATLAVRPASSAVYAILLTPFVITVLNLSYPGGWDLAASRVLDTLLGAGCALVATELLCLLAPRASRGRSPSARSG